MRVARIAAITALALGSAFATMPIAQAQGGDGPNENMHMWGTMARANAGCPMVSWSLQQIGDPKSGAVGGAVWYSDMSGFSTARGMVAPDGKFTATVTSVSGSGPNGTVTGMRQADGMLTGTLNGAGCSKLTVRMHKVPMVTPGSG